MVQRNGVARGCGSDDSMNGPHSEAMCHSGENSDRGCMVALGLSSFVSISSSKLYRGCSLHLPDEPDTDLPPRRASLPCRVSNDDDSLSRRASTPHGAAGNR